MLIQKEKMGLIRTFAVMGGIFLLFGSEASGQEAGAGAKPLSAKHGRLKKTSNPPSPTVTPAETPQAVPAKTSQKKFEVGLYGGLGGFQSPGDNTDWPTGGLAGFWTGYFMDPRALVGVRLEYAYFQVSPEIFGLGLPLPSNYRLNASPDMTVLNFVPTLKLNLAPNEDSPVQAFAMLGLGFMNKTKANGVLGNLEGAPVSITGYSTTVPMVSFALGVPFQLPDDFSIPVEIQAETGFTAGQNTTIWSLLFGVNRDY